jgi:hypothetical protein
MPASSISKIFLCRYHLYGRVNMCWHVFTSSCILSGMLRSRVAPFASITSFTESAKQSVYVAMRLHTFFLCSSDRSSPMDIAFSNAFTHFQLNRLVCLVKVSASSYGSSAVTSTHSGPSSYSPCSSPMASIGSTCSLGWCYFQSTVLGVFLFSLLV